MYGKIIVEHPKFVVSLIILSIIISGYYASNIKIGVDTGRFELKNKSYKTYNKILNTFGSEKDDVIIVAVSKDGYALNKKDILQVLNVERELNNSNISSIQSLAGYIAIGLKLLDIQDSLPSQINITIDNQIFTDMDKIKNAISNYEYMNKSGNSSIRNDAYNIFALLPSYSTGDFEMMSGNFSYTPILNESKYRETRINSTNMLIDEIEIYQNLSNYGENENMSISYKVPENYSLEFVNNTIDNLNFNITRCDIGMESYNITFFEWYSYNLSFQTALALIYSGYKDLAKAIYEFSRNSMLKDSRNYENNTKKWENYSYNLTEFENNEKNVDSIINETKERRNETIGTLRNYLNEYLSYLYDYKNSTLNWKDLIKYTNRTINVSNLMIEINDYGKKLDDDSLPLLNETIENIYNNTDNPLKLINLAEKNIKNIEEKIGYFYVMKVLFSKIKDIMKNLKSILMRDESSDIKQDSWNLIVYQITNESSGNVEPFYRALKSYKETLNTVYWGNSTNILWDYLTLGNFEFNYSNDYQFENLSFNPENYTIDSLINEVKNRTQSEIDKNITRMENYKNESIERIIENYTSAIDNTLLQIQNLNNDINFIDEKYSKICNEPENLTAQLSALLTGIQNTTKILKDYGNSTYSLRAIEDYFSDGKMYSETLLSKDHLSSLMIIELENSDDEWNVKRIADENKNKNVEFHVLGSSILVKKIEDTAKHDMFSFLPISLLFLVIILFFVYGNLRNVLLSLSAVIIVLIWLFAFSSLIGWNFDPITLAVPIMLVGIGIDDGIYVTLRYMEERTVKSKKLAAIITISTVGGALVLTTVTSIAGFMANTISNMEDIRRFGILASIGLLFSFIAMNTYLPAANMLLDSRRKNKKVEFKFAEIGAKMADKNPYTVIAIAVILSIAGVISLNYVNTQFNLKDMAPQNSEIVQYYHFYERNFNASIEISYIYMEGNLSSPQVLKAMADTEKNIENDITVVHDYPVISPWSIMEKYANAKRGEIYYNEKFIELFKESDMNHDGIPDKNITILYNMLKPEIDSVLRGNKGIFIIHTDSQDLKRVDTLVKELNEDSRNLKKYVNVEIAGDAITGKSSIDEINENQIRSLTIAIIFAIIVLIILFRSTKGSFILGVIAAIPIMLVVTWNWLLMYILNISLNVMTNTIASLCVGLGVDYGIHITHRFVEESSKYHDLSLALHRATGRIGKGLIGASTTTITAIGIMSISSIPPLSNFALILSFSIFFAFLSSLIVLPSLLIVWARYRRKRGYDKIDNEVKRALREGDYATLCKYHVSMDYCIHNLKYLLEKGKIREARKIIEQLKEEGYDYTYLLRSDEKISMEYE